ncbi:MAG: hypothetical protein ACREFL_18955, partial [Stellaceae bacterium]
MRGRAALIGMVLCAIAALPAAAAETVEVRAGEHAEGYARIAVEWPAPAAFEAKLDGDTLTVHFARPFTAPLAALSKKLKDYVSRVGQSADGTAIVAQLKRPVKLKTATVNGRIATIDLVAVGPPVPQDHPSAKPQAAASEAKAAAAQPAAAPETVRVRGAEHREGFARIAVEWPSPIAFDAKLDGDRLTIRFSRAFKAPLAPLARELDHYVVKAEQSPDGMAIVAQLKRPVEIRTRTVNGKIAAIDLIALAKPALAKPAVKDAK